MLFKTEAGGTFTQQFGPIPQFGGFRRRIIDYHFLACTGKYCTDTSLLQF